MNTVDKICDSLKLTGEFLKYCGKLSKRGQENPLISFFGSLWNFLNDMLVEFSFDFSITENVCRCLKYSIRALSKSFSPYLKAVLLRLIQEFEG